MSSYHIYIHSLVTKPIRDMHQWGGAFPHCLITYVLCFKTIRNKFQGAWFYTHYLVAHLLRYLLIRHIFQCPWVYLNNSNTHFLRLKAIRDIVQQPWACFKGFNTHFLGLLLIRYIFQLPWVCLIGSNTHFLRLILIRHIFHLPWIRPCCLDTHFLCLRTIREIPQARWVVGHYTFARLLTKVIKNLCYPAHGKFIQGHIFFYTLGPGKGQILWTEHRSLQNAPLNRYFEVSIHSMQKSMKNDDSIIEAIPWITPFIDVKTMNIHQKMVIFLEKTVKPYLKAVILSL